MKEEKLRERLVALVATVEDLTKTVSAQLQLIESYEERVSWLESRQAPVLRLVTAGNKLCLAMSDPHPPPDEIEERILEYSEAQQEEERTR